MRRPSPTLSTSGDRAGRSATPRRQGRWGGLNREWRLHWWDKSRFRSVLRRCAASGNPEPPRHPTAYILGLEEFRNRRRKASGLWYVCCAMEHGHAAAAYMIGTITLHDSLRSPDGGVEQALERLDWLSPSASAGPRTRRRMASVRGDAVSVMRMLTMRRWRMAEPPMACVDPWCGKDARW
nr:unnamed protein product [Digitaria exilis]